MKSMNLERLSLGDMSELRIDYLMEPRRWVLVVKVSGCYRPGSQGNPDARYIRAMVTAGLIAYDPVCLILDFSQLEYTWGNSLLGVFQDVDTLMNDPEEPEAPAFPVFIVSGPDCHHALLSLTDTRSDTQPDWLFDRLDEAMASSFIKGQQWLDG